MNIVGRFFGRLGPVGFAVFLVAYGTFYAVSVAVILGWMVMRSI